MDLTSRLRSIVRPAGSTPRELTYEPDTGRYEASIDLDRVADVLGGRVVTNGFGRALVIDRRYESDRFHGSRRVGECEVADDERLRLLDPTLPPRAGRQREETERGAGVPASDRAGAWGGAPPEEERTLFVDLETTGLSGGAGTVAFLVGCGWFDMGAFQVRQFLLASYASERALLDAVASCFDAAALLVTYNGKTFDVPVMETRWMFHRMRMPLESVRHFDLLHPARRLWRSRDASGDGEEACCRLSTLERVLCDVSRVGDVPGLEIPGRYFRFLRSGDARPLEPVLEHNRLDLISLAAVAAHAVQLVDEGHARCRDAAEALALAKVYERAGCLDRALAGYRLAADDPSAYVAVRAEAIYRLGVRLRRDRRFVEAADCWRRLLDLKQGRQGRRREGSGGQGLLEALRQYAVEALAIHHEHRERDYLGARELTLQLLEETEDWVRPKTEQTRHRLARLEKKLAKRNDQLFQ
jgi:uncharacterized protein YprB with RNaseH-like and TPR domain